MARGRDELGIHLLGGFSLVYDDEQLPPLPSRHARLLFAWLALQSGRPQSRTLLADRFWPDLPESRGRRRLSHALWQIQDSLGELALDRVYVTTRGDEVAFDVEAPSWIDVHEFERRLDEAEDGEDVDTAGLRHLRRALQLYGGDLLAGSYDDWVVQEQDRLRQRYVGALQRLATACEQRGNFEEALAVARRLTHEAPLREDAHRSVMRLCVLVGQPSSALEQFERCRSVLAEELGAGPSAETLRLHDSIAHSRAVGPAPDTAAAELETRALVGRDDERVRLVDQLERTLTGQPGTVFVEGEPGVGKSHLLAQLADDARWRGFTVVTGSCEHHSAPFAWLRDALVPALDRVRVTQLDAVVAPVWLQTAASLLPPLRHSIDEDRAPTRALTGADGAERMRHAITHVLTGLAELGPLLLVLEDLHRADEDTLGLLLTLARHPSPGRLLLALSYRDVEARSHGEVWSSLRAIDRDARPVRLTLRPMSAFETGALLREALRIHHVPAAFVDRVHRETGGNPLYAIELLRSLRDAGALGDVAEEHLDQLDVPVTPGVRTLIGTRLGLLDDHATAVLEQAAVLGSEFPAALMAAASDVPDRERTLALGELVRRNLLQIDDEEVRFTHTATRTVIQERLTEPRARGLHAAAAGAVESVTPGDVEALAAHLLVAAPERAVAPLRRAADDALQLHAYGRAATHLTTAITTARTTPMAVSDRIDLLLRTESVLDVLGRRQAQEEVLDELDELVTADPATTVDRLIRRATLLGHTDRIAEAVEVARAAIAATPEGAYLLRARALTALGHLHTWAGDTADAVDALGEAVALAAEDDAVLADAEQALGAALRHRQRFDEAATALRHAQEAAARVGDHAATVTALGGRADIHGETGDTATAVELHEQAVELARQIGFRYREGVSLVNLGTIRLMRGEPAPALDAFDDAATVFTALGNTRGASFVALNRAWLRHRWLGDDALAMEDAYAARGHFEAIGNSSFAAIAVETIAGIARRSGDLVHAGQLLRSASAAAESSGDRRAGVQLLRGHAELALAQGASGHARALTIASDGLATAQEMELAEFVPDLAAIGAVAAAGSAQPDRAAALAARAAATVGSSAEPHRVHHRLGLVAEALGDEQSTRRHHRTAGELLATALAALDEARRVAAGRVVPIHAAIVEASALHAPRTVELRLARMDAPRGRALSSHETVPLALELPPLPDSPTARREQLLGLLAQVDEAGAQATVEDLSTALEVSTSTVRRDLRQLRAAGHDATTRGTGTG